MGDDGEKVGDTELAGLLLLRGTNMQTVFLPSCTKAVNNACNLLMPLLNICNPFMMLGSVWISMSEAGVHRRDCLRGAMEGRLDQVGWGLGRPSLPATRAGWGAG